jgi:hypothetical protein
MLSQAISGRTRREPEEFAVEEEDRGRNVPGDDDGRAGIVG